MKTISLLLAAALLAPLSAQEPGVRPPRHRVSQPQQQVADPSAQLPDANIMIHLEGTTTTGDEIDLQLTGVGPTFTADQMIGEENTVLSCQYGVSRAEKGYRVSYNITVRVRIATNVVRGEKEMTNYEYRDVSLGGAVLCTPGVPVVILRNAKKPLELTLSEEVPAPPPTPGSPPAPEGAR